VKSTVCCAVRRGAAATVGALLLAVLMPGCERREIVQPTPQMDVEARFWVRVLLVGNATECTVTAPSAMYASRYGSSPATGATGPMAAPLDTSVKVTLDNGQLLFGATPQPGDTVTIGTERPHVFTLNKRSYRGKLMLTVNADGRTFSAVNSVPLEPYLAGVVGAEMYKYWEPEALKAQAIAARTYCLYTKDRFGTNRGWDVSSTQASQVYRGIGAESAQVWKAVRDTHGMILVSGGGGPAEGRRFPAYYSSICGGHTEDCRPVFGEAFAPLRAVPCPYCKDVARLGLFFWPMAQYDRQTVTRRLAERYASLKALGEIQDIVVIDRSTYGDFARLTKIRLVGATGKTDVLRGEDFRLALDPTGREIQSTICKIVPWADGWAFLSGRGWGHGVGMCQCGAEGMARLGKTAQEILQHYYPGSEIANIY
jgi:stage II sporulation protein D